MTSATCPIILQDLKDFKRKMEDVWREGNWCPPGGVYLLNDAVVNLKIELSVRYCWPVATVTVVEWVKTYP